MRTPVVNYKEFRLSRINEPQFAHLKWLLPWIIYFALYFKKTGKEVLFVPMYVAPNLKGVYFGEGVRFSSETPVDEERTRICNCLKDKITEIAVNLPEHTVVPYRNIPKRDYPKNTDVEVAKGENTGCEL